MSSLQKFHRRTQPSGPPAFAFTVIGGGDDVHGFWAGTAGDGVSKLIVSPLGDSRDLVWGSYGIVRGNTSLTDGISNTNTLYSFGSAAHPAAYWCKTLATGGYNTWYLPAKNELMTLYSNQTAINTNSYIAPAGHWSSTEYTNNTCWATFISNGGSYGTQKSRGNYRSRPVRRVI